VLDDAGGIRALAREVAEDAASTKVVRAAGLRVRLVDAPFAQPLGRRGAKEIWRRQTRWAQLRRASFPLLYTPEILSGAQWTVVAGCVTAFYAQWPMAPIAIATLIAWYSAEMLLARAAGWPVSRSYPIYAMTRDFMLPILWICGWLGSDFVWRGNAMSSAAPGEAHRT
jgi:ceramide glucosyltransferase